MQDSTIQLLITIIIIYFLITLYYDNKLTQLLTPIETTIHQIHQSAHKLLHIPLSEHYTNCPPSDCDRYNVRKDQLIVRNPFKWPWSGSDEPQYAVPYDEVNKTADQRYKSTQCWRSRPVINCENARCKHPFNKNRDNPLDNKTFALDN